MKKIKHIIFIILVTTIQFANAQDFHVAQYDIAYQYMNPAQTGSFDQSFGDYKVQMLTRSQWRSMGIKPFFTTYLSYDMPYIIKDKKIGLGAFLINNNTGSGNMNTTQFMLSGSYNILDKKALGRHVLTTGLQIGVLYKTFNTKNLYYDNQYSYSVDGGSFDKSVTSGETYSSLNLTRFDANIGIYYKMIDITKKYHPYVGFSMAHLTKPNEAFFGDISRMPIKIRFYGGCDLKVNEEIDVTPRFLYLNQAKAYEITAGILASYLLKEQKIKLLFGSDYRYKDAVIINAGAKNDALSLRFSYDINSSYLNKYTNGRGAWEISLSYTGVKGKSFKDAILSRYF
ncbi:MAG: PorP/SprF family type IX secretion system membrane protein [Bacteroidetes bacterium]|nr:PorP/SprF family type IX secretion system membrane protein [Bacteroidota bacterium]